MISCRAAPSLDAAPASIYVVTADAIRRSGARSLPEALRLAPNLQVARIDATQYAVSARGFNIAVGNTLLVLIDGRTVYRPFFSGVLWDQQDMMFDEVARIEVIRGPGPRCGSQRGERVITSSPARAPRPRACWSPRRRQRRTWPGGALTA